MPNRPEVRHNTVASARGTRQNHSRVTEQASPSTDILDAISRCAAVMGDDERLQDELHALRLSSDPVSLLATSLIDLERARRGVQEARAAVAEIAESLLVFWRDGSGLDLARAHPLLESLWEQASSLLSGFEAQRFKRGLAACWEARTDAGHLTLAIEELVPEGDRRVEFARCLYHLELARLLVDSSRAEFARRAGLLAEAYQDPAVATELVGGDPGLEHLWKEVVPYLDEFFEHLEAQAERQAKADASGEEAGASAPSEAIDLHTRRTDPGFQLEAALERESDSVRAGAALRPSGIRALPPPPSGDAQFPTEEDWSVPSPAAEGAELTPSAEPTPVEGLPGDTAAARVVPGFRTLIGRRSPLAPQGERREDAQEGGEEPPVVAGVEEPILEAEALGIEEVPPGSLEGPLEISGEYELVEEVTDIGEGPTPPPLPPTPSQGVRPLAQKVSHEPRANKATADFWLHTFQSLELLPGDGGRSARILSCETRADRKRLNEFIDSLAPHLAVPEARGFACLLGLMLAGQTKEKSLFGQPNPRRAEALAASLPYLATTTEAAMHAAVWFELDGPETQAALAQGLSLLVGYLAYCNRTQQDPLASSTVDAFTS